MWYNSHIGTTTKGRSMLLTIDFFPGDFVTMKPQFTGAKFKPGQVYRVSKFMQKNVRVMNVDTRAAVSGRPECFEKVTDPVLLAAAKNKLAEAPTKRWVLGEVCTLTNATIARVSQKRGSEIYPTTKFVVLAQKGDTINVARLGGDNDRYWRFDVASLVPATAS